MAEEEEPAATAGMANITDANRSKLFFVSDASPWQRRVEEQNVTLRKYAAIVKQQEESIDMYVGVLSKHGLLPECVSSSSRGGGGGVVPPFYEKPRTALLPEGKKTTKSKSAARRVMATTTSADEEEVSISGKGDVESGAGPEPLQGLGGVARSSEEDVDETGLALGIGKLNVTEEMINRYAKQDDYQAAQEQTLVEMLRKLTLKTRFFEAKMGEKIAKEGAVATKDATSGLKDRLGFCQKRESGCSNPVLPRFKRNLIDVRLRRLCLGLNNREGRLYFAANRILSARHRSRGRDAV